MGTATAREPQATESEGSERKPTVQELTRKPDEALPAPRFLYSHSILAGLPASQIVQLQQGARSLSVRERDVVFRRGDPPDGCYWLRRGFLKMSVASSRGEERILAVLGAGALVGELALFNDQPRTTSCHALSECHVLHIGRAAFLACLRDNPALYPQLVETLAAQIREVAAEAVIGTFLSVRGRVARALMKLAVHIGRDLPDGFCEIGFAVRHSDIAAMASATRESVSRVLSEWRRDNLLNVSADGKLIVHKLALEKEFLAEA
jgi:CRP/FNR family transcriptional regulator